MQNNLIKFPSIEQFRSVVKDAPKKIIEFTGTVKLHGTNASVVVRTKPDMTYDFYAQSRNNVITPENDNLGFAKFAEENQGIFVSIPNFMCGEEIALFGEWCGAGIQKGVGISQVEKMFVIFAVKIDDEWVDNEKWRKDLGAFFSLSKKYRIFNIYDFPIHKLSIDFNAPELSINELGVLTKQVEERCPVAGCTSW